mmetsp:Transcript_8139/g.14107  ORF Transcript_8139/g.14107 Transcript_8139/m.14107 type:complete len:398 (+) Transcript_8139:124-1317(+)
MCVKSSISLAFSVRLLFFGGCMDPTPHILGGGGGGNLWRRNFNRRVGARGGGDDFVDFIDFLDYSGLGVQWITVRCMVLQSFIIVIIIIIILLRVLVGAAELVGARLVDGVEPHLVKVDEEDDVIAQARNAVHHWHGNGKGKDVVHKRVERLVHEGTQGQVRHTLQAVVHIQLRTHGDESKHVHPIGQSGDHPRVPAPVRLVQQRVHTQCSHHRVQNIGQHLHGALVVLVGLLLQFAHHHHHSCAMLLLLQPILEGKHPMSAHNFGHFPALNERADAHFGQDDAAHVRRIQQLQENYHLAEEAAEEGANTEPLETIPLFPKSDIILESQEGKHTMKGPDSESEGPHLPAESEVDHQLLHLLHVKLRKAKLILQYLQLSVELIQEAEQADVSGRDGHP